MNSNLNSTFAKSMNLNLLFSKSINLNLNSKFLKKLMVPTLFDPQLINKQLSAAELETSYFERVCVLVFIYLIYW